MNYSTLKSLDTPKSIIQEANLAIQDKNRINSDFIIKSGFNSGLLSSLMASLGANMPLVSLAAAGIFGIRILLKNNTDKKLVQEKISLYQEAVKKQNIIISELQDNLNKEKQRSEYLMAINLQLQETIKKLQADLQ